MRKKRSKTGAFEGCETVWSPEGAEAARKSAVAHLEAFVGLTIKGFLGVVVISFGVLIESKTLKILGVEIPPEKAADLVTMFFIALFVAIALHALNVYMAVTMLASDEPAKWIDPVLTGAGVLSPLACWPGKLGLAIGGLGFGLPFGLWWAMDITAWRLHGAVLQESGYPLRYAFTASGVGVGLLVGATCVKVYRLVQKAETKRKLLSAGVAKWLGAALCTWAGYSANVRATGKDFESFPKMVDIFIAYPLTYTIPAWGLVPSRWLLWAGGAAGLAALSAAIEQEPSAAYPTGAIAIAAVVVAEVRRRREGKSSCARNTP